MPEPPPLDAFAPLPVKRGQLEPFLVESSPRAAEALHTIFVTISEDMAFHAEGPAVLDAIAQAGTGGDEAGLESATGRWSELTEQLQREADGIRDLCIAHARRLTEWGGIAILLSRAWDAAHTDMESITDREAATYAERVRTAAMKGMARISRSEFEAFIQSQPTAERTGQVMREFADVLRRMPEQAPAEGEGVSLPPLETERPPGCLAALKQLALAFIGRGPKTRGKVDSG